MTLPAAAQRNHRWTVPAVRAILAVVDVSARAMMETLAYLATGCIFGMSGGLTPGPTTALVVSQTVRFGFLDGVKVAIAPLLTDAPIIAASLLLVGELARFEPILGVITLLGAAFLVYLAVATFRVRRVEIVTENLPAGSLRKGFTVNLLNPHPYLFWFVIGAPLLLKAWSDGLAAAALLILGLYTCLVGSKVLIAWLVDRSRGFLKSRGYVIVNRLLGVALAAFALLFARDGLRYLGVYFG